MGCLIGLLVAILTLLALDACLLVCFLILTSGRSKGGPGNRPLPLNTRTSPTFLLEDVGSLRSHIIAPPPP